MTLSRKISDSRGFHCFETDPDKHWKTKAFPIVCNNRRRIGKIGNVSIFLRSSGKSFQPYTVSKLQNVVLTKSATVFRKNCNRKITH